MIKCIKENWKTILWIFFLILLPIIFMIFKPIKELGKQIYKNIDFWTNYMTYVGTVILGGVALIQNENLSKRNDSLEEKYEKLLELKEKSYEPRLAVVNNDEIILQEATETREKSGEIEVSYRRNSYDKKPNYSYTIYMSEKVNKSLVLYLKYIGKTFSEKIEIIKIEMKNREESKRIIEVNKNVNLFLQENVLLSFVLNMDTEYNKLEYIAIDFNMHVNDVPYNEKIHISFKYDESHSDNKNLYINGVDYEKGGKNNE